MENLCKICGQLKHIEAKGLCKSCYFKDWRRKNQQYMKVYCKKYHQINKERLNQQARHYWHKNKERFNQQAKQYREVNRETITQYAKQYYQKNKEKLRQQKKQYYQKNKEKILLRERDYICKKRFGHSREEIFSTFGAYCHICLITEKEHRQKFSCDLFVHHKDNTGRKSNIEPNNSIHNLTILCRACHKALHATKYSERELIEKLKTLTKKLGRPPKRRECQASRLTPAATTYTIQFGSWNNALKAANLK